MKEKSDCREKELCEMRQELVDCKKSNYLFFEKLKQSESEIAKLKFTKASLTIPNDDKCNIPAIDDINERLEEQQSIISDLKLENQKLSESTFNHHLYIEEKEARERSSNFIITGLDESTWTDCTNDKNKLLKIMCTVAKDVFTTVESGEFSARRIGMENAGKSSCRPV